MTKRFAILVLAVLAATPSAHGSVPDGGVPDAGPRLRDLFREPPPAMVSAAPTITEWKSAEPIAARRPMPYDCRGWLFREWVKIRCSLVPQAGGVLVGPAEDVAFHLDAKVDGYLIHGLGTSEVVFPVRRGEHRVIQLTGTDQDEYSSPHNQNSGVIVSQQWLAGDPGPSLTLSPNTFERDALSGIRLATPKEAQARGVQTHGSASENGWPVIVEVEPGSLAAEGGAEIGDHVVMSRFGELGLAHMHELYAFGLGAYFDLTVQRNAAVEVVKLRRIP